MSGNWTKIKQVIEGEEGFEFRGNNKFQYFRQEEEMKEGQEMIDNIRVKFSFFEVGLIAASLSVLGD